MTRSAASGRESPMDSRSDIPRLLIRNAANRAMAQHRKEHEMASTRCKFRCGTVIDNGYGGKTISLNAAYAPDDPESENGKFWTATPNGLISLQVNNPDGAAVFETGKDYYVDFTPAS